MRYVTCQKCYSVYKYSDCIEKVGTIVSPQVCVHKVSRYARPCNGVLLKTVELQGGEVIHYPIKVFCYMPLKLSLELLLKRPGFHQRCEHWRLNNGEEASTMICTMEKFGMTSKFMTANPFFRNLLLMVSR